MKTLKHCLIILIYVSSLTSFAQNFVYNEKGQKKTFESEELEIHFQQNENDAPSYIYESAAVAPALLAVIPTLVDVGFRLTQKKIEQNVKAFSAEYTKQKSYLDAGDGNIPDFAFTRSVKLEDEKNPNNALTIVFKPHVIKSIGFIYYVDNIDLNLSSAKHKKIPAFDYAIELKLGCLVENDGKIERKVYDLSPIVISSVGFGSKDLVNEAEINDDKKYKHRTEIVTLPAKSIIVDVSVKIVETNPQKVRAEKILSLWNENKDEAKTIINNFLPKEEDKENEETTPPVEETETNSNAYERTPSSNKDTKKVNP